MHSIIQICFPFRDETYHALVRTRSKGTRTELRVTIMNGELERMLYGNHIFERSNGHLIVYHPKNQPIVSELQSAVGKALENHLKAFNLEENPIR